MPVWALTITFWLHLLATVTWIGSLAAISFLILPAARHSLDLDAQGALIDAIQRRLEPLAWFCLALLVVTGMFQLSTSPHYNGLLSTSNQWSIAILVKHIMVLVMIVVSALQTWEVLPSIQRAAIRAQKTGDPAQLRVLRQRERLLLRVNLLLSMLILAATALARVS
jgi:uncharacterized membrane protein